MSVNDVALWGQWAKQHAPYVLAGGAALGGAMLLPGLLGGSRRRDAHWATWHELKKAQLLSKHGVVVGRIGSTVLRYGGPGHVFVVAATQTGKSRTLKCTLLEPQPVRGPKDSIVAFDPKNELYETTGRYRASVSRVIRLAPCSRDTDCYNILDAIRFGGDDEVADIQLISSMLANPDGMEFKTEAERFWVGLSATVFGGLIVYGHTTQVAISLGDLYQLVTQGDFRQVAAAMAQEAHPMVREAGTSITDMDEKQYSNVIMTLRQCLTLYADPRLADMGVRSDFTLEELRKGPEPLTVYVSIPFEHLERLRPWTRLFFRQLLHRATAVPNAWRRQGYHRLRVIGEEFPSLKRLQIAEDILNNGAGLGVQLVTITPSMNSMEEIWGAHHNFKDNSHVQVYFGIMDEEVAETVSQRLGTHTIREKRVTRQGRGGTSVSWEEKKVPLMSGSEITHMDEEDLIIIARRYQVVAQHNPWDQRRPWADRGDQDA